MLSTSLPSPATGELPTKLTLVLRQHLDFDSGHSTQRSWVEVIEPTTSSKVAVTFIDSVLASSTISRLVTDEIEGPIDPEQVLETAFQNMLGVWPIPRSGLLHDLAKLGYEIDWKPDGTVSTITPVTIRSS